MFGKLWSTSERCFFAGNAVADNKTNDDTIVKSTNEENVGVYRIPVHCSIWFDWSEIVEVEAVPSRIYHPIQKQWEEE